MALTRRDFFKFGLAAGAGALAGWYINKVNRDNIQPRDIPGAGEPGHFTPEELEMISVDSFLKACARCGVCIAECPFKAIKSTGWQLPLLTNETRSKCPGIDVCGVCRAVCPTSALEEAYHEFEAKHGEGFFGIGKDPWWEGDKINTDYLKKADTEEE